MADEAGFIVGDSFDGAASKKEAAADRMGIVASDSLGSSLRNVCECALLREHEHHPGLRQDTALIRPVRVQIKAHHQQIGQVNSSGEMLKAPFSRETSGKRFSAISRATC